MFSGNQNVNNGVLGKFDSSVLPNGSYVVKLTAIDKNGLVNEVEDVIDVAGDLKLGNFRLSFTDLSIPLSGIPISVTRSYDSLNANSKDDFGYGWRLEFRDTDLRTSLKKDEVNQELGISTVPFKDKTRVYITLPGGKREAFTFKPSRDRLSGFLQAAAPDGVDAGIYHPEFVGDKGVTSKLSVVDTRLSHVGNEYYDLGGTPYNPADDIFGGKYVLTTKDGIVYEIDGVSGDLLTATDTNGNKVTFTDAGIFSDSGKSISFGRDAGGRITSVTDAMGYQVKYSYDEFGDLVKVTDQENRETKFIYDNQRTHYLKEIIDPLGRTGAKTEYDEKGRLKQVLNGANVPINMEYKPEESIQIIKDVYGKPTTYRYDERGNVLEVKDALGHSTLFEYDEDNNLTQSKDANNLITKYDYDEKGNLTSRTEAYCGCPTVVPGTTYYTYNQYGQPTSVVLPTGAFMKMEYDRFGNMLSMKDGKGSVIQSFTYYTNGLVKTETDTTGTKSYFYDNFGNVTKSIDPDGKATTMEYFADGKLKKMVEDQGTTDTADDETSTFTYDKLGREKRADYGNGIWVEYGYGVESDWSTLTAPTIGTIQRKFTDDGKLKGWVTPDGGTPTFLYDSSGRLWRETDATGKVTTEYGYDDAGRVTTIKDVPTGAITRKKYDAGNRPIEEVDPLGGYTKYTYHPQNGKVVTMERGKYITNSSTGQLVVDPVTNEYVVDTTVQKQVYFYEYNGLQTTVIDPLGRKTTSVQDEYYLPTETIYKQREGKDWSTQTKYLYTNNLQEAKDYPTKIIDISGRDRDFTYDSEGRLWKATDLANNTYTYTYGDDGLELIESPTSQTNSGNIKETLRYGYDALGNLNKVTYGDGKIKQMDYRDNDNRLGTTTLPSGETITYDYDEAGRIKSETTKSVSGTITNTISYTYDANSNVKTITDNTGTTTYHYDPNTGANVGIDYPNGSSIAYTHDLLGRVKTITEKASPTATAYVTTYDYDAFGNLKSVLDPSGNTTTMKYDVGNRLKERLLPNGVKSVYEYDELDRVKSLVHTNASGTVLASVTYERKGVGEPTKVTREDGSYVLLEYDEALRVKKESYYNAAGALQDETSYTYDAAGKRLVLSSTVSGNRNFNYKSGYQLDSIGGAVAEDYDYDVNGRLSKIVRDGKTLDLVHDAGDLLTVVDNKTTGSTIRYTYDGQGRRVAATEGSSQRRFLVAPAMGGGLESTDLISDANGNLISNYVYAGGSSPFMRLDANGNPVYYLTDAMGSTIGLADGTGASAAKFNYDSFGNLRSSSGVAANTGIAGGDFRFQGQWLEQGTGIYNFRARDYDAKTGMFLSRDPVDPLQYEPESFNPYQFVYHNPFVYSDPTGMFTLTELNSGMHTQDILNTIRNQAISEARGMIRDYIGEFATNLVMGTLQSFLPGTSVGNELDALATAFGGGDTGGIFEEMLRNSVCNLFHGTFFSQRLWVEPFVNPNGTVSNSGINCDAIYARNYRTPEERNLPSGLSPVDFIFKDGRPTNMRRNDPLAYVVGDIKITIDAAHSTFTGNSTQSQAMSNYASKYEATHFALYVTFKDTLSNRGRNTTNTQLHEMQEEAFSRGIILFILNLFN
ncbi:RHS repeat domain-containing protein [Argonema antarcticum]|uniref:RHS repeat domain-containing protein n=1 Tax=Argonema antarcticum TaxID=2942763 RepID=UPI0020134CB6|nr:RHS repeat-associated core domain-containing protein [Argonema antarcticum]